MVSSRFAFKISGGFSAGYDWIADDHTDLNPNANVSTNLTGYDNPAQDPANDMATNHQIVKPSPCRVNPMWLPARVIMKKQVVDYSLQNIKADAGLYFKISPNSSIVYLGHIAVLDNVYQRANRFRAAELFYSAAWYSVSIPVSTRLNYILIMKIPGSLTTCVL